MPSRLFDVGQKVMARWPKTTLYFNGEIIDFNDIEYLIRFDDEDKSEFPIKYKDVAAPFSSRSTRSRSRSLGRSTKGASKSPSRRSPSRKSPGRPSGRKSSASRSPSRKSSVKKPDSPSIKVSPLEVKNEITKNDRSSEFKNRLQTTTEISSRQSARIASTEKKISYTEIKSSSSSNASVSNNIKVDTKSVIKSVEEKNRFMQFLRRFIIALWINVKSVPLAVAVIALPLFLTFLCTAKYCKLEIPKATLKSEMFYNQKSYSIALGFVVSCLLLSLIPVGKVVKTRSGARVRCNGYLCLIAGAIAVGVLLNQRFELQSIYILMRPMLAACTSFGLLLSLALYIKSYYAPRDALNPAGNTGYYIADLIEGREVNPRIGTFDIKYFLFRLFVVLTIFVSLLTIGKDLQAKDGKIFIPLIVSASMKIFYFMDLILFEDAYLTTFEYSTVGCGLLLCVGYLTMPFLFTFDTRYVLNHGDEMPWYCLTAIVLLYLVGYLILRGSNSQKHAFRTNPADPALTNIESLPTSSGKRLIVSGLWGIVRHPNYLGDIIVQLAMTLLCGFKHAIPWLIFGYSVSFLIVRIFTVEKACKKKYGLAWSSYTSRVPSRIIPKIF